MTSTTIKTDPYPTVTAGSELTIRFTNGTPNTTIELTLSNGEGTSVPIEIELDSNGEGEDGWDVPASGWSIIRINGGNAPQVTVGVK